MERPWIEARPGSRLVAPATSRNREPILAVLRERLPERGVVLEVGSGSGEHAAWLAGHLPGLAWQPSEPDRDMHPSIAAWAQASGAFNIRPPLAIDAATPHWGRVERDEDVVAILCINTLQVAPWSVCQGLMAGAARLLPAHGMLYLYGPFARGGVHTAPSNEAFDRMLRAQDPAWGVRDLDEVAAAAEAQALTLAEVIPMPANNLSVIFRPAHGPARDGR